MKHNTKRVYVEIDRKTCIQFKTSASHSIFKHLLILLSSLTNKICLYNVALVKETLKTTELFVG